MESDQIYLLTEHQIWTQPCVQRIQHSKIMTHMLNKNYNFTALFHYLPLNILLSFALVQSSPFQSHSYPFTTTIALPLPWHPFALPRLSPLPPFFLLPIFPWELACLPLLSLLSQRPLQLSGRCYQENFIIQLKTKKRSPDVHHNCKRCMRMPYWD